VTNGANNALLTGALKINSATLWVDKGVTLYAATGATGTIITVTGTGSGIFGDGTIDGQGQTGYWANPPGPTLIQASGSKFVMYGIHLQNSPGFHVKITGDHFVLWGNTLQTPSTNAGGLTPDSAHNTDGIDPGAGSGSSTSYGYIVCNTISVGDDHIAVKGGTNGHVSNLVIAHNHFGAGHGMSIGSETGPGGVSNIQVYDLTVDGNVYKGASNGNANGIRIKSYQGAGGLVDHVSYQDICTRNMANPILLEPNYSGSGGSGGTPQFTNITIQDFHDLSGSKTPTVTLDGYDSSHETTVTLNNVAVDGTASVKTSNAVVTLTGGGASFKVPGATGSGTPSPISCSNRFVTFPVTF
jgi:polygalacturonase